jgi:hydrogenase maturation factor
VCDALGLNPLGLISSGALLVTVSPDESQKLITAFKKHDIMAKIIGTATKEHEEVRIIKNNVINKIEVFERDELARYYDD